LCPCQTVYIFFQRSIVYFIAQAHCRLRIATIVVVASRGRGFHRGWGGGKTCKFAQKCLRKHSTRLWESAR